jgi:hypothetical protein
MRRRLFCPAGEGAKVFAEAERLDALLERGAMATAETLQERFELNGACDVLFNLDEFAGGEFSPARADGRVVTEAAEEELDFGEGKTHLACETDKQDAMKGVSRIAALAADAHGWCEEAASFVVADGGGIEVGAAGELADFHDPPRKMLDLKLTLSFSIWGWGVANPNWRKAMKNGKGSFVTLEKKMAAGAVLAVVIGGAAMGPAQRSGAILVTPEKQVATVQSKFYCNIKALTGEERTRHTALTEKLLAARKETVEMEKGYEFQYSPADVSLTELAQWAVAESKCCPFFDFHIDLENQGKLACLRLTGEEGIKAFIRAEFNVEK